MCWKEFHYVWLQNSSNLKFLYQSNLQFQCFLLLNFSWTLFFFQRERIDIFKMIYKQKSDVCELITKKTVQLFLFYNWYNILSFSDSSLNSINTSSQVQETNPMSSEQNAFKSITTIPSFKRLLTLVLPVPSFEVA